MKNIIFSIFLILITSCKNKEAKVQEISDNTSKEKSFEKIKVENLNLHLICLSEIKKETVIFNSCDAGNAEIYVYTFNDSSYILLTGTQEDELYLVKETYKLESDTIYFKVNYYGSEKEGLIKYIITDSFKGISKWQIKALDMNYSLTFVEEQKKNNFKTIEQPCKECWEEEGICEETAIKDSIEKMKSQSKLLKDFLIFGELKLGIFMIIQVQKKLKKT